MNSRIRRPLYISFKSWLCCCSLPSVAPQQWAITWGIPEMERAYRKYQNGQVWAPGITEYWLYSSLNFRKIKRIWMENVAGEQGLALQQLFPYKSSYFSKNSDCHKISFLNDGGLTNLAILIFSTRFFHFWFVKLLPIILWKVGHVMAYVQRAYKKYHHRQQQQQQQQ